MRAGQDVPIVLSYTADLIEPVGSAVLAELPLVLLMRLLRTRRILTSERGTSFLDALSPVRQHIAATEVYVVRAEWPRTGVRRVLRNGVVLYAR